MNNALKQHLIDRGMDPSKYPVVYDHAEGIITFFLFNGTGSIVGYQQYRPSQPSKQKKNDPKSGRYYTYLPKETDGVFGLDVLNHADRTIYIVEGVFKAAVLHRLGYNAIAVLTSTPKRLKPWFKILRQTWNLVAIGDNDDAGQKLVNIVKNGFQSPTDLDEMSDEEIIQLLKNNS
jgi:DNA primase